MCLRAAQFCCECLNLTLQIKLNDNSLQRCSLTPNGYRVANTSLKLVASLQSQKLPFETRLMRWQVLITLLPPEKKKLWIAIFSSNIQYIYFIYLYFLLSLLGSHRFLLSFISSPPQLAWDKRFCCCCSTPCMTLHVFLMFSRWKNFYIQLVSRCGGSAHIT